MLILTRNMEQSIIINGDTKVTVVGINRGQVRLAIEAPDHVIVDREEIHQRKLEERSQ